MPKERSHWILALRSREALPEGNLKHLLFKEEPYYLLGAVAPDSVFMPVSSSLDAPGDIHYFHGQDNPHTLKFWQSSIEKGFTEQGCVRAFLYGLTSHIQSDAVFHPVVYYFSGWPGHPKSSVSMAALRRHYRLETLLDFYMESLYSYPHHRIHLHQLLNQVDLKRVSTVAGQLFFPEKPLSAERMERYFQTHGYYQKRFSRWDFLLLSWFLRFTGISLEGKRDLFYRSPLKKLKSRDMQYRHPVSGEWKDFSWNSLAEEAIQKGARLMQRIEEDVESGNEAAIPFGPHPELGLPSEFSSGKSMTYCQPVWPRKLF